MFYCNDCAKKYEYPETLFKSVGKCECCGEKKVCNEMKSSELPKPKYEPDRFDIESLKKVLEGYQKRRMTWYEEWYSMLSPKMCEALDKAAMDYIKEYGGEIEEKRIDPVKVPENIVHELSRKYFGKK